METGNSPYPNFDDLTFDNLNFDVLEHILNWLPYSDFINFGMVCQRFQKAAQLIKLRRLNLSMCYDLNVSHLLNKSLTTCCKSVNMNHCYWLKPGTILNIISKTNLRELRVVECQVDAIVIGAIAQLNLTSLSISWNAVWRSYISKNLNTILRCFQTLKSLDISYSFYSDLSSYPDLSNWLSQMSATFLLYNLSENLLKHCKTLEHLNIFSTLYDEISPGLLSFNRHIVLYHPERPTPLPNLKSLVINFPNYERIAPIVTQFLKVILNQKIIPIENACFGNATIPLIAENGLESELISIENSSTFCLSSNYYTSNLYNMVNQKCWQNKETVKSLLRQSNFKKYALEYLVVDDFLAFISTICTNMTEDVEEISFYGAGAYTNMLLGIQLIAQSCTKLTYLDLTFQIWIENNNLLLNTISGLKNLEKLYLTPFVLSETNLINGQHYTNKSRNPANLLWKVTKNCELLNDIRITTDPLWTQRIAVVTEGTLSSISYCLNLQELHLANFTTVGPQVSIRKITQFCKQLQTLYIANISNINCKMANSYFLKDDLIYATSLKHLSINLPIALTTSFVNALSHCTKLEKICFEDTKFSLIVFQRLIRCLPKFKKLCYFFSIELSGFQCIFNEQLRRLKAERASLCIILKGGSKQIPLSHLHMHRYTRSNILQTALTY